MLLLEDCLKLYTSELLYTIDEILYDVYDAQIRYVEQSLQSEMQQEVTNNCNNVSRLFTWNCFQQKQFVQKNADFLAFQFLKLIQTKYESAIGFKCPTLTKLENEYSTVSKRVQPSTRNNIYKYSSNEYL